MQVEETEVIDQIADVIVEPTELVETTTEEIDPTPAEPETFTPNYAYKAYGEEYEIPENMRGLITVDNQDEITKLYEQAGGFDHVKTKLEKSREDYGGLETNYNDVNTKYTNLDKAVGRVEKQIAQGDYASAFKTMGIDEQALYRHVFEKLNYGEMNADQRTAIDERQNLRTQNLEREESNDYYRQQNEDLVQRQHEFEMTQTLASPEYKPMIDAYNLARGNVNAFKEAVNHIGLSHLHTTQQHLSVADATKQAVAMLGLGAPVIPAPQAIPITTTTQTTTPAPTPIPSLGSGSSTTPIKKRPMSIDDINKEYSQLSATA